MSYLELARTSHAQHQHQATVRDVPSLMDADDKVGSGGLLAEVLEVFGDVEFVTVTRGGITVGFGGKPPTSHQVASRARVVEVRTTEKTRWHEPGRGYFTIPAGTVGQLIDVNSHPIPERERAVLRRTIERCRRDSVYGAAVVLEGRARFIAIEQWERIKR